MFISYPIVAGVGPEPTTSGLWIRRSNQLSYPAIVLFLEAVAKLNLFFDYPKNIYNLFVESNSKCKINEKF